MRTPLPRYRLLSSRPPSPRRLRPRLTFIPERPARVGGAFSASPPPPPPPPRRPSMSSSTEMSVFELKIDQYLLDCTYCQQALRPDQIGGQTFMCAGGHIYCRDCTSRHEKECISYCRLLNNIISKMKFKCNYCVPGDEYIPYPKFVGHLCNTRVDPRLAERQCHFEFVPGVCMLDRSLLVCSECELPLQPPIFRHIFRDVLVYSPCYRGDIANYVHCSELDYLIQGITGKCVACKEHFPFSTLALHQLCECPSKHKLQKIAPGSSAQKNLCDEEETETFNTPRLYPWKKQAKGSL